MKPKKVVRMPLRRTPQQRTRPATSTLRARTATADEAYDEEEDYGGEDEPNMKFSHAVLVVLILHVIAVGGIFAFNSIKAKQTTEKVASKSAPAAASTTAPETTAAPEKSVAATAPAKTAAADKNESPKTAGGKTHTIQAGDTLTRVATLYSVKVEDLEKENEITSYTMLRVGQVLKIPTGTKAETKPAVATPKVAAAPVAAEKSTKAAASTTEVDSPGAHGTVTGDTYVVVKGDNPYSIAKKLHVSYNELLSANDIKDATKIQIGQKLKIPKK